MQKTQNYNLNKPEAADPMRVSDFNENADKIDAALKQVDDNSVTRSAQVRSEAASALAAYKTSNDAAVAGCARIACGTYTGKGTYGSSNKNTLTFDFAPKIVFVFRTADYGSFCDANSNTSCFGIVNQVFYAGGSRFTTFNSMATPTIYSISGKKLTWYTTFSPESQMNASNTGYGYIAIG